MNDVTSSGNKLLSVKGWITLAALVLCIALFIVANKLYEAQPANVVINPEGLNSAEYTALSHAVAQHDIGNFFTAPLPKLQEVILQQDWVSQVNIERQWGKGIVISVIPRTAVAHFGTEYFIDSEGRVFQPANTAELTTGNLTRLQGDIKQADIIMQQMQQINQWFSPLDILVEDMVLTPRMTWVIKFNDGLRIIVDNERTSQKLMNLSQLMQSQLSNRRSDIASFDLRYKNGFVIDWKDDVLQSS